MSQELPRLSAKSLQVMDDCPRLFALRYRLNRYWPAVDPGIVEASQARRLGIGRAFHALVETQQLGLDVVDMAAAMEAETPTVQTLWEHFLAAGHDRLPEGATVWTEQALHFQVHGAPFMVRFDRLVRHGSRWTILDWKTGVVKPHELQETWQTRLYLYALVEAGQVLGHGVVDPGQVQLVYWEVGKQQGHRIAHDRGRHEALRTLFAAKAKEALTPFDPVVTDDPHYPRRPGHCPRCVYDSLCNAPALPPAPAAPPLPRFSLEPLPNPEEAPWRAGS